MKTLLVKAKVKCWWYLLTQGMWRGECEMSIEKRGRTVLIAAIKGTLSDFEITRIFYRKEYSEQTDNSGGVPKTPKGNV